jgi:putative hemolysin
VAPGTGLPRVACLSALVALGLLGGCARVQPASLWPFGSRGTAPATAGTAAPAAAAASSDPVVAFAARAQPGASDRVTLADGQPATVQLARSYHSANGRECREVRVTAGMAERARVVCAAEGGWVEARPLLRGGGGSRP